MVLEAQNYSLSFLISGSFWRLVSGGSVVFLEYIFQLAVTWESIILRVSFKFLWKYSKFKRPQIIYIFYTFNFTLKNRLISWCRG